MLGSGAMVVMAEGTDLLGGATTCCVLPQRVVRQVRAVPSRLGEGAHDPVRPPRVRGAAPEEVDARIVELEKTMRLTSICGLGQVALGPASSACSD